MEINRNILTRYFLGQCTENEKNTIREWMDSDEAHRKQFIRERIRFDATMLVDEQNIIKRNQGGIIKIMRPVFKVVAAVLLMISCSYFFSYYFTRPEIVIQHVYAPAGNRMSLTLPDGSLVWLNSNTTLRYPNVFGKKDRVVELNGEAYFDVKKNDKPFIVKTSKYNVEVLGTTFDIEDYADKTDFRAVLLTGRIKLYKEQDDQNALNLNTGEEAVLVGKELQVSENKSNSHRWLEGLLIIEDDSFEDIMSTLEKYFDQTIIIRNNKVKDLGYRGKLRIADGVEHALRVLQKDFNFTYQRDEDTNTIYIN